MTCPDDISFVEDGLVSSGLASSDRGDVGALHRTVMLPRDFLVALLDHAAQRATTVSSLLQAALLLGVVGDDPGRGPASLFLSNEGWHVCVPDLAVRRALAGTLALAAPDACVVQLRDLEKRDHAIARLTHRNGLLRRALEGVAFEPLREPLRDVREAALLFGFVSERCFDEDLVLRRFRKLALVYHPDTGPLGSAERMGQLIDARGLLLRHVRALHRQPD